jgi:hypothetical protein
MANSTIALLDLPNKLLRMIAKSTNRDGLLGLSMICRDPDLMDKRLSCQLALRCPRTISGTWLKRCVLART